MLVTADPAEGEALTGSGNDLVKSVPMPSSIPQIVEEFIAEHHVEQTFYKRERSNSGPSVRRTGGAKDEAWCNNSCPKPGRLCLAGISTLRAGSSGSSSVIISRRGSGGSFSNLEKNNSVDFYVAVGKLGRTFMEIESQGFSIADLWSRERERSRSRFLEHGIQYWGRK
jgi:hypothetical protein